MTTQKDYVDYKNAGDIGTDSTSSIQPLVAGEAVTQNALRRPSENLRTRTEIARDALKDLLYYRNRAQYVMECAGAGVLSWGGTIALGGTGTLNNTTQLTIRPMLTPRSNIKGLLSIGTTTVNAMRYEVQATAYETDGMNAVTVEHRDVTGTVSVSCVISDGPIKRILVVFDSANAGHNSTVTATAVNIAIGLDADLNGKILAVDDGVPGNAILTMAETPIDIRTHTVGTDGNATMDVEEHTLAAGALVAFTALNPMQEGDLLAIRYDYVIEPAGGDPDDPKGGVPGGRSESNAARANTNVAANLFIAQNNPEWLPGAIPLCKIVNNIARWVDGTNIAAGFPAVPGSALGTNINTSGFQGAPTLTVNGGLLSTDDTLQEALDSADDRLGQLRASTWNLTDSASSTGGHFDSAGAVLSALAASPGGGHFYVRRGMYLGPPAGPTAFGDTFLEGERPDLSIWDFATAGANLGGRIRAKRMRLQRTGGVVVTVQNLELEDCTIDAGLLQSSSSTNVSLTRCVMNSTAQAAGIAGIGVSGERATFTDCDLTGPDTLCVTNTGLISPQVNHFEAVNCKFTLTTPGTLLAPWIFIPPANSTIRFTNCRIENNADLYPIRLTGVGYSNVKYVFTDCVIVNSGTPKLLYLHLPDGVEVHFVRCQFRPNNLAAPTAPMIEVTTGNVDSRVSFQDCEVFISEVDSVAPAATYGLLELGCSTASPSRSGVVHVDGLRVVYQSSASGLHSNHTVRYRQVPGSSPLRVDDAVCRRLTVELAGKRSMAGTDAVVRLQDARVEHLHISDVDYPDTGSQALLDATGCSMEHLRIRPVPTPAASSFAGGYLSISGPRLADARLPRFRAAAGSMSLAASCMEDISIEGHVDGDVAQPCDISIGAGAVRALTFSSIAGVLNPGALSLVDGGYYTQCHFNFDDGRTTIVDLSAVGVLTFNGCRFRVDVAGASTPLGNTAAAIAGSVVVGNEIGNVGATTPTVAAPPATSVITANLLRGSV